MRYRLMLCLALSPLSLEAQAATDRLALQTFQDSLAAGSDSSALRRLDRWYEAGAPGARRGADLLLRRALVRIRLGELGDGWSYGSAIRLADRASSQEPSWPWTWFAAGLAHQHMGQWRAATPSNLGTRVGYSAFEDAAAAYARALAIDPGFTPALRALADVCALRRDVNLAATVVLPAYRRAAGTEAGSEPDILLGRGTLERLVGDPDSSVVALQQYAGLQERSGAALHQLAWSEAVAGGREAEATYYEGAASDDGDAVAAYRSDLALVADDSTLEAFDATRGPGRAEFLRRFWTLRDRRDLRDDGARLVEHFRRRTYAEQHFVLLTNRRSSSIDDIYRSGTVPFDDRGMVYLRQGRPDQTISAPVAGMQPNETWVYRRSEGDLMLHFKSGGAYAVGGDIQDYRLVRSLFDLGAQSDAQVEMLLASRAELLDVYGKILNWGGYAQARGLDREQAIVETSIEVATITDANPLHFNRVIQSDVEALEVGTRADSALVHLVFAIPVEGQAGGALPVHLRASFYDASGRLGATVERDTVLLARAYNGRSEALGHVEVPLEPGDWLYRVALQINDSTGHLLPEASIRVRPFDGGRLALSDLSLGTRARGIEWLASPQDTALFEPHPGLSPTDKVELYFEVYGVAQEDSVRTEIRLRRSNREALHLSYQQEVAGSPLRVRRTLDLNSVKPGRYELEVRVVTSGGGEVVGRREIEVGGGR